MNTLFCKELPNYILYGGVLYKPPNWVIIQAVGCIITYVQIIRPQTLKLQFSFSLVKYQPVISVREPRVFLAHNSLSPV